MARRIATILAVLGAAAALAACDKIGNPIEVMSSKKPTPDEFQVVARAPIYVPPAARQRSNDLTALPTPQPGTPSPLEPDPNRSAQQALLGSSAAAQTTAAANGPSEGEQVLLGAAAAGSNAEIRTTLEEDAVAEAEAEAAGPYEPPSIFEVIGLSDAPTFDPEDVVDPVAESQRLQREGIAAPNDPAAQPDPATGAPATDG
ncbi:MAG: DUF3035 domain-containing protein [Pseudomonadota bacterium]